MRDPALRHPIPLPLLALILLCLLVSAALHPIDHDEGQYVGALALMREGLPYRDFVYLQTPLQPILLSPLLWIAEGWLFPAHRMVNALFATGAAVLIWKSARSVGASVRSATLAVLAMVFCDSFLFGASVARNDALPMVLAAAAQYWLVRAVVAGRRDRASALTYAVAGLCLGMAIGVKISYAFIAAPAGLFLLATWKERGVAAVFWFAAGGVAAMLPVAWIVSLAPEAAWFGIIDYSLRAPFQWRAINDLGGMTGTGISLLRFLAFAIQGSVLLALLLVIGDRWARLRRRTSGAQTPQASAHAPALLLLEALVVGGLVAALLPKPVYSQYLVPMLAPLFVRMAPVLDAPRGSPNLSRLTIGTIAIGIAVWLVTILPNGAAGHSPPIAASRTARQVACLVGGRDAGSFIAGLSPAHLVDSGVPIDRRFVAGPFTYRMQALLTAAQERRFHLRQWGYPGWHAGFGPAAIVTGWEDKPLPATPHGLDAPLVGWARRHGYHRVEIADGRTVVHLRDRQALDRRGHCLGKR